MISATNSYMYYAFVEKNSKVTYKNTQSFIF